VDVRIGLEIPVLTIVDESDHHRLQLVAMTKVVDGVGEGLEVEGPEGQVEVVARPVDSKERATRIARGPERRCEASSGEGRRDQEESSSRIGVLEVDQSFRLQSQIRFFVAM
jgi:hypothetical protein